MGLPVTADSIVVVSRSDGHNSFVRLPSDEAMARDRGDLDVDFLLKVVLVLVVIWLALEVVETLLDLAFGLLGLLRPFVGLLVVVLIVLFLLDRI
jgi:hypothetical protein